MLDLLDKFIDLGNEVYKIINLEVQLLVQYCFFLGLIFILKDFQFKCHILI